MSVLTRQEPGVNLRVGGGFVGLYPAPEGERGRIDHFCLGLDGFDAEETRRKLGSSRTMLVRGMASGVESRPNMSLAGSAPR